MLVNRVCLEYSLVFMLMPFLLLSQKAFLPRGCNSNVHYFSSCLRFNNPRACLQIFSTWNHIRASWPSRGRCAETIHSYHLTLVAHILAPPLSRARFNRKALRILREENRVAITLWLAIKQFPLGMDTIRTWISFLVSSCPAATIQLLPDPVAINMMSGFIGSVCQNICTVSQTICCRNWVRSSVGTSLARVQDKRKPVLSPFEIAIAMLWPSRLHRMGGWE